MADLLHADANLTERARGQLIGARIIGIADRIAYAVSGPGIAATPSELEPPMARTTPFIGIPVISFTSSELASSRGHAIAKAYQAIKAPLEIALKPFGSGWDEKTNQLLADLKADETRQVVRVLLTDYYDPLYGYGSD